MHYRRLNFQTLLKPFSIIVIFGMIYLFLRSDVSRSTNNLGQIGPITPTTVRPPPTPLTPLHTCRALFTISHDVHHHLLQTSARNRTHSEDVRGDGWAVGDSAGGNVGDREQLMKKKTFHCGAPTMYYYSLAALLPKLLSFSDDSHYGEERVETDGKIQTKDYSGDGGGNISKQTNSPFFRERSRVVAGGGVLPYVPCVIASYQQPAAFTKCVRRRLERKPLLWLFFMGDSKIRNVFTEFINRTDSEYNYTISYLNVTVSWPTLRQRLANRQVRWCDMEASTSVAQGLRISFSFKKMSQTHSSEFNEEIAELWQWASGEPSPDLLVVGYTSWIVGMRNQRNVYTADTLDLLMEKHSVIVPLLEQISRWTRVLVLPQSRIRPHSSVLPNMWGGLSDALYDWSEMTFLQLLKQNRESHGLKRATREDSRNPQDFPRHSSRHRRLSQPSHSASHRHILPMEEAFQGEPQSYRISERGRTHYHSGENEARQQTIILQEPQRPPGDLDVNPEHQETTERTRTPVDSPVSEETTERTRTPVGTPVSEETTERTRTPVGTPVSEETTERTRTQMNTPVSEETTERTRTPVDTPVSKMTTERTRTPVDTPVSETTERTRTPMDTPVSETTERTRTSVDTPILHEATKQTRIPVDIPVPQEATEQTRTSGDIPVPQEATEQSRIPVDNPVLQGVSEQMRTPVDTPVLQEATEHTRIPVDTPVLQEATEHTRIPVDIPVPQEATEHTRIPVDIPVPQEATEQTRIPVDIPVPQEATEQTRIPVDIPVPQEATEQTRISVDIPVPQEAREQSRIPMDTLVPQEASEQTRTPVDTPVPQETSKQTRTPVDTPALQEATEHTRIPVNSLIQEASKQTRIPVDIPIPQEATEQIKTPVDIPVPQEVTEHTRIPVDISVPQEATEQTRTPMDTPVLQEVTEQFRTPMDTTVLQEASKQTRTPVDTTVPEEATEHTGIPRDTPVLQETAEQTPSDDQRLQKTMEQAGIIQEIPTLLGTTEQTWTFQDPLVPTRSTSGLWWWDSSLPLNLASILECNQLFTRGLASHPIYQDDMLLCSNLHHAGSATNSDLVTMLLNLLCNSLAGLHHNYCCT